MAKNSESIENERENEIVTYANYECLVCGHKEKVRGKRKDYSEVVVCPKCNGAFIDTFKILKYKNDDKPSPPPSQKKNNELSVKVDIDVSDALKGLKAVQREAKKTARVLKEVESFSNEEKLLVIELDSIDSVPKVTYKGNEIKLKTAITMGWETSNAFHWGDTHILIDYIEENEEGMPINKKIREFGKPNNETN